MATEKKKGKNVLSGLIRQAGQSAKAAIAEKDDSYVAPICSVLEYIEQPWGLNMNLYPAQRFIVKLYYNLPLDEHLPEEEHKQIRIFDIFGEKVLYRFSEKQYLEFLYNEGRCNIGVQDHDRRELVLAIGRRGGKCVREGTLVLTSNGIFPIEDLGQAEPGHFSEVAVGVAQEAGRRSTSSAFYNGGVKPTYSVRTRSGYNVTGTGNHRIKVMSASGRVEWRYLDEIRVGDCVAVNRSSDLWAPELLNLRPYHNEDGNKDTLLPDVLDERLANLMGYLVGDGTWGDDHAVAVTVEHSETWDHLRGLFRDIFGEPRVQMDTRTANTGRMEFCGVRSRRFLDALGWKLDTDRYSKMIPWSILRSPKNVVCAFLRGLFETDGCAERSGAKVTFSSASFRLAHEVQTLLLNLGIVSSVRRKWNSKTRRHYANLTLLGRRSREVFADLVGFDSAKKHDPLVEALESASDGKSDTESLPFQQVHIRNLLESVPKRNPAKGELGGGRSKLREVLGNACKPNQGEDLTYSRLRRAVGVGKELGADTAHFEELLRLDYFYDPVESVEEGEDQVYDLTVPDGESFVANGLTNHNTTLSGIFASYEVYRLLNLGNPQAYYGLPNGNRIQIISVATSKDQASLLFNEVTTHLAKCDYFKPFVVNNTLSHVNFRTPYDIEAFGPTARHENGKFVSFNGKATLRVTFKPCIAKGLRGAGNVVIILDEVAHFLDKGNSSASEIYDAIIPSAAAFSRKDPITKEPRIDPVTGEKAPVEARIILISSPLGKSGKFYERYDIAMRGGEGASNILAIQAPTWEINPTVPSSYYREKYHSDPNVFMVEHGAQFSDQTRGWIEREADLTPCLNLARRPIRQAVPRMPHQMGIDVGLVEDGTAIAITHNENGKVVLDYHEVWSAGVDWRKSNPHLGDDYSTPYARTLSNVDRLDFDEIANWIEVLSKRFFITSGLFDRWNGIPLEQALHKKGLKQFTSEFFNRDQTGKMYQAVKLMMYDKKLDLYDYPVPERAREGNVKHSPLIAELLSLQARQISRNIVLVEAPKVKGAHDDASDALIRSIWLSIEAQMNQKHTYRGSDFRPRSAAALTPQRYQMARARAHGGLGDRPARRFMR